MSEEAIHVEEEWTEDEDKRTWEEELHVAGDEVVGKVQELLREAAVRKITVRDQNEKEILSIPLWSGVAGMLVLGPWSALALVGAWIGNFSIIIEYEDPIEAVKEAAEGAASQPSTADGNDLTSIKGIGPKTAEKLAMAGVATVDALAKMSVAEVMEITGANQETAADWIAQAEGVA